MASALHHSRPFDASIEVVIRLRGAVQSGSLTEARSQLAEIPPAAALVLDLTDVTALDASGVGCLIGAIRRARESGGEVVIEGARPAVAQLLDSVGIDRIARLAGDRSAASSYSTAL